MTVPPPAVGDAGESDVGLLATLFVLAVVALVLAIILMRAIVMFAVQLVLYAVQFAVCTVCTAEMQRRWPVWTRDVHAHWFAKQERALTLGLALALALIAGYAAKTAVLAKNNKSLGARVFVFVTERIEHAIGFVLCTLLYHHMRIAYVLLLQKSTLT